MPCYVPSAFPSNKWKTGFECLRDSTRAGSDKYVYMPLAVFYHKLCCFSSPFCCSKLCPWHNHPLFFSQVKQNADIKGRNATLVILLLKCSTEQKSSFFVFFFFLISPRKMCFSIIQMDNQSAD